MTRNRLTNLGLSLALVTSESGGYTVILVMFFAFLEPWKGLGPKCAIIACYILCIPLDIPIQYAPPVVRDIFWPNRTVITEYSVALGPMIRPLLFMLIPFALSCTTLREVWFDVRTQGWRERGRFDRDAPLLAGRREGRRRHELPAGWGGTGGSCCRVNQLFLIGAAAAACWNRSAFIHD